LVILGSGSAAFAAAIKAHEYGASVAMIERGTVGGTCVNVGCIPSKNLIEAARAYWEAQHPRFEGLSPTRPTLDFPALVAQEQALVQELRQHKYLDIVNGSERMHLFHGEGGFLDRRSVSVGDERLESDRFIIATGARPLIPDIPGIHDGVRYLTNDNVFALQELPEKLLVIGGGFIALELGQAFQRFGSEVHLFERGDRVLADAEPELSETIRGYLEEEGVQIHTQATVGRVEGSAGDIELAAVIRGRDRRFKGTHLLLAVGRVANSDSLNLDAVGVETRRDGFIMVDREMRTSADHMWAVGDVVGRPMATPVAAREGIIAAENAIGGKHLEMDFTTIPRAVFTDPEIASVGLTDAEANAAGLSCRCAMIDLTNVPKAAAIRDTRGLVKIVADNGTDRLVGVHIVANRAADIVHEAALALRQQLRLADLIDMIHVYPTMSEALKIAAQSFTKDVSRLSCCAE
jgi:mercuric reductase